jgi:hypothetical protein
MMGRHQGEDGVSEHNFGRRCAVMSQSVAPLHQCLEKHLVVQITVRDHPDDQFLHGFDCRFSEAVALWVVRS